MSYLAFGVPRTGLEPARLSARAPETRASTIPPPGHRVLVVQSYERFLEMQNFCRLFSGGCGFLSNFY